MSAPPSGRFRLNASTLAGHFKYRCERRFRWTAVPRTLRERAGTVGEGVPRPPDQSTRPGIKELMQGGDDFELGEVEDLARAHGDALVWAGPAYDARKGSDVVGVLSFERFLDVLRAPEGVAFVAQPEIGYDSDDPQSVAFNERFGAAVCARFGLDPATVEIGISRPDLIQFVRPAPDAPDRRPWLRVWDFKSSREPRHEHFVQVAWYTFLLEALLDVLGLDAVRVDTARGAVKTHRTVRGPDGQLQPSPPEFDLDPYRRALARFLSTQAPGLLALAPEAAHWHVQGACLSCEYHKETCAKEALATGDVACVPYLTSEARRTLVAEGLGKLDALAALADRAETGDAAAWDTIRRLQASRHDLNLHLLGYLAAAQALREAEAAGQGAANAYEADRLIAAEKVERWHGRPSLTMPSHESVRIVLAAEQDAVTHRCYALGFRLMGRDADGSLLEDEQVFLSARPPTREAPDGDEGDLLDAFLVALFGHLDRIDAHNRATDREATPERHALDAAREAYARAKAEHQDLMRRAEEAGGEEKRTLDAQKREAWAQRTETGERLKEARRAWHRRCSPRRLSVQAYVYDTLDLRILREAVERHLFARDVSPERFERLRALARLAPPASMLPDPGAFRSLPFTVVQQVLREAASLPVPFLYDLKTVSRRFKRERFEDGVPTGEVTGAGFYAPYGFHWSPSNQIAFERIHDVWKNEAFAHPAFDEPLGPVFDRNGAPVPGVTVVDGQTRPTPTRGHVKVYTPEAVRAHLDAAVRAKLRATGSVAAALRQRLGAFKLDGTPFAPGEKEALRTAGERVRTLLPFPKNPFYLTRLYDPHPPLDVSTDRLLDALDTFTVLEESHGELALKQGHTATAEERAGRFEAMHDLRFLCAEDAKGQAHSAEALRALVEAGKRLPNGLTFLFDGPPEALDSKRSPDDLSLVLTNVQDPGQLIAEEDGELFRAATTPFGSRRKVEIVRVEPGPDGVRVRLRAGNARGLVESVDLGRPCVIDEAHADFNSPKTLAALRRLRGGRAGDGADHVRALVARGTVEDYAPALGDPEAQYAALDATARQLRLLADPADPADPADRRPPSLLNAGQRRALNAAFREPLSLVWGPPGTGKTHTLAHTLVALASAAHEARRPLRVLVTAQSHHAIANVLRATARVVERFGVPGVTVHKVVSSYGLGSADRTLGPSVRLVLDGKEAHDAALKGLPTLRALLDTVEHGTGIEIVGATVWAAHKMAEAWRTAQSLAEAAARSDDDAAPAAGTSPAGPSPAAGAFSADAATLAAMRLADPSDALLTPEAGEDAPLLPAENRPVAPLFDLVLVDEASQLKLADALIPLLTLRPGGAVVLAGDDQQLPPILRGRYPAEAAPFLTSVFAFMRHRLEEREDAARLEAARTGAEAEAAARAVRDRTLCLLDENFRMNHPLTEYPRRAIYQTYSSTRPDLRAGVQAAAFPDPLLDALLDPERPVVLVRYAAPQAFTARNPLEAELAARLVDALHERLLRPNGSPYAERLPGELPGEAFAAEGVAVVAPHRAQNAAIRSQLRARGYGTPEADPQTGHKRLPEGASRAMPLVDTVDKAQGQEFDVVVVSYGVADEAYAEAESAFLLSRNRFNVAVTRARAKVIVLVCEAVLNVVPTDQQVLLDATMLQAFDRYCGSGHEVHPWTAAGGQRVDLHVSWRSFDDLS